MASRDRLRRNDIYEQLVDLLKELLRDHAGLRELNAARRKKAIEEAVSDEKETADLFSELLKADPLLASLFGTGDRLITSTGPGSTPPYSGKKFPTYFRLSKNPPGGLIKKCPINWQARVEFETDAVNDYFKRADCPGTIAIDPADIIEHSNLWNGRFVVLFRIPWDSKPGDKIPVTVRVEDVETEARRRPFLSHLMLIAEPEQEHRLPGPNPGRERRQPHDKSSKRAPTLALPQIHEVKSQPDVALEVKHDPNGGHEFFVNAENKYLLTALTGAKEEEQPLLKFWFKYGLALCALGMLQEHKRRAEANPNGESSAEEGSERPGGDEEEGSEDTLKVVNAACAGLARVIIPVVRGLYRGPGIAAA